MAGKKVRVRDLANAAGLEFDEALVTLWDVGIEGVDKPDDIIAAGTVDRARQALGMAGRKEITSRAYWQTLLQLSDDQWWELLANLNIGMSRSARRLPKGAIGRLARHAATRGVGTVASSPPEKSKPPRFEPMVWRTVGRERYIRCLSAQEIESIHGVLVEEFAHTEDPFGDPCGVRNQTLLESTAFRPDTSLGDERKYRSAEMCAAALLHSIVHNHPFHNGNKRTALVSMLVMLDEHDLTLTCHEEDLFRFVLRVAQHKLLDRRADSLADREVLEIASWIRNHSRLIERGERPIKWGRLRRILNEFGCTLEQPRGVGNRMNIERAVTKKSGFLGRQKTVVLRTQLAYGDEGREVERNSLNKVRSDLELDEEHGVDSAAFYGDAVTPVEFIHRHAKTLKRLAKL